MTRIRRIRLVGLKEELSVTSISLSNALLIQSRGYKPFLVCHEFDSNMGDYLTKVYYKKEENETVYFHLYSGFTSSYFGEGSRGFIDFLTNICNLFDKSTNTEIITKLMKTNHRHLFYLDKDNKDIFYAHISSRNVRKNIFGGRKIKLKTNKPIIIKSWNKELTLSLLKK
jgi:hypothetical protein